MEAGGAKFNCTRATSFRSLKYLEKYPKICKKEGIFPKGTFVMKDSTPSQVYQDSTPSLDYSIISPYSSISLPTLSHMSSHMFHSSYMHLTHVVGHLLLLQYHHCNLLLMKHSIVLHIQLVSVIVLRLAANVSTRKYMCLARLSFGLIF